MPAAGGEIISPAVVCGNEYGQRNGKCHVMLLFQLYRAGLSCNYNKL